MYCPHFLVLMGAGKGGARQGARPFLFGRRCGKLAVRLEAERLGNGDEGGAGDGAGEDAGNADGNG